jgi:hypothetical protein
MSFTYTTNIPFSTHNPSADQPVMEENTNAINQWVGVDHVPFNTSGLGQHEQVTFNSNNVPTVPTSPPVLFTNVKDGFGNNLPGSLAQLFYYSGANTASSNQYFLGASGGSVLLNMGIVVKWGTLTPLDNTATNFSANSGSAFPNNCFAFFPSIIKSNTSNPVNITVVGVTASTFQVRMSFQAGGTTNFPIYYIALGN